MTALLEIVNLRRLFRIGRARTLHAIDDVSLRIGAGRSLGLVGESGSGKSTLARLVVRLDDPTAGRILYEGNDIGAVPAHAFGRRPARSQIQFVFQGADDTLNPALSTARNIAIGLGASGGGDVRPHVEQIAAEVELPRELLERRPHQLSGGQQARAGIARALIARPRLLVLDEPTAALDVSVQATVLKLIDRLRHTRGLTLLFVSHDLEVIRLMCDDVAVLYLGRIAETGPVADVLARPLHPYTRALVAAAPGRAKADGDLIGGEPASPIDPDPNVCLFANRCPLAMPRCMTERPRPRAIHNARIVACHRSDEGDGLSGSEAY
ncbi:MAG TPA: ABC transporter ATP-binding protein [Bradyrhizobium sp.]|nr:ABC transporter ATP-binding protein [Bradyrhizobium sp.]